MAELIKRWRAADGSEHNSKQAVAEHEARQALCDILHDEDPVNAAITSALEVIAALRVFAPVKRPRKPKAELPKSAINPSDEYTGGYGSQDVAEGKKKAA